MFKKTDIVAAVPVVTAMVITFVAVLTILTILALSKNEPKDFCHSKGMEYYGMIGDEVVCRPLPRGYRKHKMEEE